MKKLVSPTRILNSLNEAAVSHTLRMNSPSDRKNNFLNFNTLSNHSSSKDMKQWLSPAKSTNYDIHIDKNHRLCRNNSDEGLNVLADECISASATKAHFSSLSNDTKNKDRQESIDAQSPPKTLRIDEDTDETINHLRSPQPELHLKSKVFVT